MQQQTTHNTNGVATLNWDDIEYVFLDMDGTLLDLNYDNHVWNELVPRAYAEHTGMPETEAQETLLAHMRKIHGSIEFYSFDYWSSYTGIDLIAAHQQATDLVAYRPGALAFLQWLQQRPCKAIIATNAHPDSIRVKDCNIRICAEVDAVVSSHSYAAPKEADGFWQALQNEHPHDPRHCVFIDDNEPVLDAARRHGIGHLFTVTTPDSERPSRADLSYACFDHFAEICPGITALADV